MNHAILIKRKLPADLADKINSEGRSACLWFDAYYNTGSVTQESELNSDLLVCDLHGIYRLDAVLGLGDQEANPQICDQVFHQDNIDRLAADEIWRHKQSPSLSVGDIIFVGDLTACAYREEDRELRETSLEGFQAWICCTFGWRELTPAQMDLFRFRIGCAGVRLKSYQARKAA